ncbi:MAG: GNAT family N-acetyltransferase [Flavobacteriaceae bacterium]|jgi:putative acetyltransferase|nr:GNAT family N-acetyltransferase [Flavobacteriaceae bacterium]MDG1961867.1 GNAT family N-acetyltransferase [Flavobacteriaceae bacterium]
MVQIRLIEPSDDQDLNKLIKRVLEEFKAPQTGTAYEDASLDQMFATYQSAKSAYFVLHDDKKIIGGGGIAPLRDYDEAYCELQKMYFLPEARGRGLGQNMMSICLEYARNQGFSFCYLETMDDMLHAQHLYQKMGFQYIDGALGNTGHYSCGVHMLKRLDADL